MNDFDIYFGYIEFSDNTGGKKRPIIIFDENNDNYITFEVLAVYSYKKRFDDLETFDFLYEIQDIKEAGLLKRSYIDVSTAYEFDKDELILCQKLGKLSEYDKIGLISKFNQYNL
jgi:hypothetical protein